MPRARAVGLGQTALSMHFVALSVAPSTQLQSGLGFQSTTSQSLEEVSVVHRQSAANMSRPRARALASLVDLRHE